MKTGGVRATPTPDGVPVTTNQGKAKSRFKMEESLQMLGATAEDIDSFVSIFCPNKPVFSATESGSGDPSKWKTIKGGLDRGRVVRHLLDHVLR